MKKLLTLHLAAMMVLALLVPTQAAQRSTGNVYFADQIGVQNEIKNAAQDIGELYGRALPGGNVAVQYGDSRMAHSGATLAGLVANCTGQTSVTPPFVCLTPPTEASQPVGLRNNGLAFWLEYLSFGRIILPGSLNFSQSGDTCVNMDTPGRLQPMLAAAKAAGATILFVWCGHNDINNLYTAAQVEAARNDIIAKGQAQSMQVVAFTDTPTGFSGDAANTFSLAKMQQQYIDRRYMLAQRGTPGLIVIDAFEGLTDPATANGWWVNQNYTIDDVHQAARAAEVLATRALVPLAPRLQAPFSLPASPQEAYDAVNNPSGFITLNPQFNGTAGSVSSPETGTVATSWASFHNGTAAGLTVTWSLPITTDATTGLSKQWQQVAITGTATLAGQYIGLNQNISTVTYPAGSRIQCGAEIEIDPSTALRAVQFGLEGVRAGTGPLGSNAYLAYAGQDSTSGSFVPDMSSPLKRSGLYLTEPLTLPVDVTGNTTLRTKVYPVTGSAASITVRERLASCWLVP